MSESARGEGGRVWVPRKPQDPRAPGQIPEQERFYFLEERYPTYGNLVPRDIATREIFDVCIHEGLSVEAGRPCVYLDLTHIDRGELDRKLGGILEIYEKFQGVDPRDVPMKIFPAVHYSMGGLWVDYQRSEDGGLEPGSPRNQVTNISGLYAIGECDYQYHGANRLGANSLLSCIFSGLFVAPGVENWLKSLQQGTAAEQPSTLFQSAAKQHQEVHDRLLRHEGSSDNPYLIHEELGNAMTRRGNGGPTQRKPAGSPANRVRSEGTSRTVLHFRYRKLDESERGIRQGIARHVSRCRSHPARSAAAGRMSRGAFQARVRSERNPGG